MEQPLTVALVAHDYCKDDLLAWATVNRDTLARFRLVATGTTGHLLSEALGLPVQRMRSGDERLALGQNRGGCLRQFVERPQAQRSVIASQRRGGH
jgi:methylglyoxal synthase